MRLIDADAVLHEISTDAWDNHPLRYTEQDARNLIEQAPTIDPRDWTPCAEGMPTETDKYWVTVFYYGELFVEDRDYFAHEKYWGQGLNPVAWMPKFKPEPYRADDTTGKVKEEAE